MINEEISNTSAPQSKLEEASAPSLPAYELVDDIKDEKSPFAEGLAEISVYPETLPPENVSLTDFQKEADKKAMEYYFQELKESHLDITTEVISNLALADAELEVKKENTKAKALLEEQALKAKEAERITKEKEAKAKKIAEEKAKADAKAETTKNEIKAKAEAEKKAKAEEKQTDKEPKEEKLYPKLEKPITKIDVSNPKNDLEEPLLPRNTEQSQCGCCRFWKQQSTCGKIIWGTLIVGVIAGAISGTLAVLNNHSSGGNSTSTDLSYCTSMPWNGQSSGGTFCLYSTSGNRMVGRWMGDFNAEPKTGENPWGSLIPWDAKFAPVTQNPDGSYHYDVVASASDDIVVQDQKYVCMTMNLQQNVQSFTATNVKANTGTGPAPVSQMDKPCPPTVNAPKNREELARLQAAEKAKSSTRSIRQSLARNERTVKAKTELNEHGLPVGLNYVNESLPQKSFFGRAYEYVMGTPSAPSAINVLSNSL